MLFSLLGAVVGALLVVFYGHVSSERAKRDPPRDQARMLELHPFLEALQVGERYEGAEGWDDWYLCEAADQAPGWVPAQVIGRDAQGDAFAKEDYCARELVPGVAVPMRAKKA